MRIELIPAFTDNYIYLITEESGAIAVVDPGNDKPVIDTLEARGLKLDYILNTHHHADHVGGNLSLKKKYNCRIIGSKADRHRIPGIDEWLVHGDIFQLGSAKAEIIETHGHTSGHICFWFHDHAALFCGDTLFSLGCGRLFEGTAQQMWESLNKIAALPDNTMIYCAHEYTASNGAFCITIEPDNEDLKARIKEVSKLRENNLPTLPVRLDTEKKTNVFLRAGSAENFAAIRRKKDAA
jgi:hydroxyacylglutathione hydrolase